MSKSTKIIIFLIVLCILMTLFDMVNMEKHFSLTDWLDNAFENFGLFIGF